MTRTFSPLASRASTAGLPVLPVAPVTTIILFLLVIAKPNRRCSFFSAELGWRFIRYKSGGKPAHSKKS
jgi:hypothetical protein